MSASSRVHIERSNQKLKVFKVLGSEMPSGFVAHADKIMTLIAAIELTNFKPRQVSLLIYSLFNNINNYFNF